VREVDDLRVESGEKDNAEALRARRFAEELWGNEFDEVPMS
jgi:hypothetical protein